ncbi:MAG: hypothetical protein FH761_02415 [Firmicutes bacterium]|nr:hypothetical protein [Bacillota bacterium]
MNVKKIIAVLMCLALLMTAVPMNQASAWKVKTHNYSANLILEEVMTNNGYVTIKPFGKFKVAPEFYSALMKYPKAYRAGSLGPDAFPDIYVGQGYIHPIDDRGTKTTSDDITSGKWLKQMVEKIMVLPKNSDERYEMISFVLGYMTHYSGDLFGHTYINQIANGVYPDMTDLADPEKAEDALSIILKHISSEGVIDKKIPERYSRGSYIDIDAPNDFILNSFVYNGSKDNGLSNMYNGINAPEHYKYLVKLRSFVKEKADYYRQYSNSQNILDYAENTAICNYLDAWLNDIDRAINEWINTSEKIARALIDNGDESDLEVAVNELREWVNNYGKYITPVPDVIIDALNLPGNIAKFFEEELKIEQLKELYDEFNDYVNDMIMNFMIYDVVGLSEEQVNKLKEAFSTPEIVLGEEIVSRIEEDMGNFGDGVKAIDQEFAPFYNTITMTKLILIGPEGYKELINRSKNVLNTGYNYSTANVEIDNLKVAIKTKSGTSKYEGLFGIKYPYADQNGTDDDIYFGVRFKDGTSVEQLFDKSGYNDFEAGDYDVYDISLRGSHKLSNIDKFYIKKKGTGLPGPDWKPEYFHVDAYIGNTKYKTLGRTKIDYYIKGSVTKNFDVNFNDETYRTALSSDIIDWLGSLDMSMQWKHKDFLLWSDLQLREDIFYKIFKDVEKYDNPNYDPYSYLDEDNISTGDGTNPNNTEQDGVIVNEDYEKHNSEVIASTKNLDYDFGFMPNMNIIDGSFSRNLAYNGSIYVTPSGSDDAFATFNDSSFVNGTIETKITIYDAVDDGPNDAGIVFRVSDAESGRDNYDGYFVGIRPTMNGKTGEVMIGYHDSGNWTRLETYYTDIKPRTVYDLKVTANENKIYVYLNNSKVIAVSDSKYSEGKVGFRVLRIPTIFQNIVVTE